MKKYKEVVKAFITIVPSSTNLNSLEQLKPFRSPMTTNDYML